MKIAVSGASGMIGHALCDWLVGHSIFKITRPESTSCRTLATHQQIEWIPESGLVEPSQLNAVDAVVHLAGRGIAAARWTDDEKQRIRESRVLATQMLVSQICKLSNPPKVFVCASAIGIYGDTGYRVIDESAPPGDDFLAKLAHDWELACRPLKENGVRVCHARLGIVLDRHAGALSKMLPLFRWMLGGRIGDGSQIVSWIALEDCVRALSWLIESPHAEGAFNLVAPNPVSNLHFTQALGRALGKPAVLPVPAWVLRLALGEMADALLLTSCHAKPARLLTSGFNFDWPELEPFLNAELREPAAPTVAHT